MARIVSMDFLDISGTYDPDSISVLYNDVHSWSELPDWQPSISISNGAVFYNGYPLYRDSACTNALLSNSTFPSSHGTYYYSANPAHVGDGKFYFKDGNGYTFSIDLQSYFGSYFKQSDTNCDSVGYSTGTLDSHYRLSGNTIYAASSLPYPVATKLTSYRFIKSDKYFYDVVLMTTNIKLNKAVNINDINTIEFLMISQYSGGGGGSPDTAYTKAVFSASDFGLSNNNTVLTKVYGNGGIYDYVDSGTGSTVNMRLEANLRRSSARGFSYVSALNIWNNRVVKFKITLNYKNGVSVSSYVINEAFYSINYYYSGSYDWVYYDSKQSLLWSTTGSGSSVYSDWYPMTVTSM